MNNVLISSLIPSKTIENKYCESNNVKIINNKSHCLQEAQKENTTHGKISGKKLDE